MQQFLCEYCQHEDELGLYASYSYMTGRSHQFGLH